MPEQHTFFCIFHRSKLAETCDIAARKRPPAVSSRPVTSSPVHQRPTSRSKSISFQSSTSSTRTTVARSHSLSSKPVDGFPSSSLTTMSGEHKHVSCCLHVPEWLDYALSVLSMRVGGYKTLHEESADNRSLNLRFVGADAPWVDNHLRPFVRDRLTFFPEVSFGDKTLHRDDFVFDQFKKDLEVSFKTVFVISGASLADTDFMSMLRASLQHINKARLQKLLLVFVDDINDLELPYGIRFYVDYQMPYLVWPEGEGKRLYFWKKFAKWTTINKRLNITMPDRCYLQSPWHQ